MNISRFKALWSLMTGGWTGLAVYVLEAINGWLATVDRSKLSDVARIVKAVSGALEILLNAFLPARYCDAAAKTLEALDVLALSLADGKITQEELDANIDAIEDAISSWRALK